MSAKASSIKVFDVLDELNIFANKGALSKWLACGAIKINGIQVSKEDCIQDINEIRQIEIGKSRKIIKLKGRLHANPLVIPSN